MGDLYLIFEFFLNTYQEDRDQHYMKLNLLTACLDEKTLDCPRNKEKEMCITVTNSVTAVFMKKKEWFSFISTIHLTVLVKSTIVLLGSLKTRK